MSGAADHGEGGGKDPGEGAGRPSIWTLTDGRPGNENPALALAEALARRPGGAFEGARIETRRIALRRWAAALPPALWALGGARRGGWPFSGLEDGGAALDRPWPDLLVGAGRRAAPVAAAMRRLSGGRTRAVQILDPRMPLAMFDAVAAPRHDGLRGANVVTTTGSLTRITPQRLAQAAAAAPPALRAAGAPRLAVLLGGPSRAARMGPGAFGRLGAWLAARAGEGAAVWVTPSRRTPPEGLAALREALGGAGWIWDGRGPNPYEAMLALADEIVVTADSVNMASEAAAAGKPVRVAPADRLAPKLTAFHAALREAGAAFALETPAEEARARIRPLRETDAAAARVEALLARR
ncbi:mitochondrial fission ELM1 family protein [Oceanicella actignis]|uniref:Nucleoside-diphosphate sugar epimerase n=1 Tax=Oceanicella actignis TaxID=1189325 RepID=A0A1M7TRS2_9RHOB|nr:mitochondrial fission ELM1 family protein [Oceanicella actignis]SET78143.1 hypothetical protein SAMN04488119_109104 [Oceanicella actignis]SHN73313.1 hypothetical protein SAMN05216200_10918 [Oceanicella actignis]